MFTTKGALRICLAAVVALIAALWIANRDQRVLVRARAAAERESRGLREQLAAAQHESRRVAGELLAAQAAARENAARREPPPDFAVAREEFIGPPKLAEMQKLHALHERAALDARFASLFKALKLSPEKLERFKSLLVEREVAFGEVMAAAAEKGIELPRDPGALERAVAQAQREVDQSVRALLGDDAFADYERYRQTLGERSIVEQIRQRLSYSGEPLSEAQSTQLLETLAANHAPPAASAGFAGDAVFIGPAGASPLAPGPTISDAAVTAAQSFLTPQQLRALQELQAAQRTQQEIMQQMAPPFGGAATGGAISIGIARPPGGK